MTRVGWRFLALGVAALTVAAAWFALNAPRLAQPGLQPLAAVSLPAEKPSTPPGEAAPAPAPAPLARALFGQAPARGDIAAPLRDLPSPAVRSVIAPSPANPGYVAPEMAAMRQSPAPFDVALRITPPQHQQYFGASLFMEESRATDSGETTDTAAGGQDTTPAIDSAGATEAAAEQPDETPGAQHAPEFAPRPEPRPTHDDPPAPPTPPAPEITVAPGETDPGVAAAATSHASMADDQGIDGMILLGVFRGSGSSRALVRTATESARQVSPGDEINGWRVSSIGEDRIELRRASQTRMLMMPGSQ